MIFSPTYLVEAVAIGFFTGVISGAFGLGGGVVSTPLLRLLLGINPHVAVGTTMALIIPTAVSGTLTYWRKKLVDIDIGKYLMIPSVVGVACGAAVTTLIHGQLLMFLFAGLVTISGLDVSFGVVKGLIARMSGGADSNEDEESARSSSEEPPKISTVFVVRVGLFAGFVAGFFGVGGGFILVPAMIYFLKVPIKTAFGTSLLVVSTLSIPGTITHAVLGHVDFPLMLSMMVGSVPGSVLGGTLAMKLKESWLRRAFGIIMLIVAFMLIYKELSH